MVFWGDSGGMGVDTLDSKLNACWYKNTPTITVPVPTALGTVTGLWKIKMDVQISNALLAVFVTLKSNGWDFKIVIYLLTWTLLVKWMTWRDMPLHSACGKICHSLTTTRNCWMCRIPPVTALLPLDPTQNYIISLYVLDYWESILWPWTILYLTDFDKVLYYHWNI